MKIISCQKHGTTDVLTLTEAAVPKPEKHQVLIEVHAASVNPVDWKIRSGRLKIKTGARPPKVLGSDFSGVVKQVGSHVNDYLVGDAVWGKFDSFKGGSYAQMVLASVNNISKKPNNLDHFQAAAVPNVALTAYQAMVKVGHLKSGQQVMINGASGGVGLMAIQMAKAMDCHVTSVCSGKNAALVKSLGADVVLDYQHDNILKARHAYDLFFDCVANQSFFKVKATLRAGGCHVTTNPDLVSTLGRLLKPLGIKRPDHIMVKPSHADLTQLRSWVEAGQLKPVVQEILPMSEVARAHQISEQGRVVGKLVLDMLSCKRAVDRSMPDDEATSVDPVNHKPGS